MKAKSSSGLNKWYHNVAQQYSINKTIQLNKHTGTQIAFLWRYEGKGRNKYRNICMSFLVTISVSRPLQMEVIKKKNQILRNNCLSPKVRCSDTPPPAVAGGTLPPPPPWRLLVHPVCFYFSFRFEIKVSERFSASLLPHTSLSPH